MIDSSTLPALSRYPRYFFDWDGCLAHTLPFWLAGYREALARRGLRPSDEVIVRELFSDWSGPARFGVPDPDRFVEEMAAYLTEHMGEVELNPHIVEVLARLKAAGRTTALLTACRRRGDGECYHAEENQERAGNVAAHGTPV